MTQVYKNNVVSVIGTPLNTLMSTITVFVNTGNDFPALAENEFFLATLIGIDGEGNENRWEVVKVIERNGDDLIVQRGQDNTTAQQWATGTRIELRVTAAGMERGETAYMWGNHAEQGYLKEQSGDDLFLTKEEADALYLSPEWGDELFLTEAEADNLFLTPAEGDELFLTQDEADDLYTEEAPTSGLVYGRANGDWVAIDPGEGSGSGGGGGAGTINLKYDDITPNGGDTYTLAIGGEPKESLGATNLLVSVNGTIQESGEAYTTSGTEITFSENLTSNDVIDFVVELTNGSYWTQEGLNLSYDGPGTKVIADQLQVKDTAQFDADVNVTGNVTAAKFIGDASELDNLPAGSQWLNNGDAIYYNDGDVGIETSAPNSMGWGRALTVNSSTQPAVELAKDGTATGYFASQSDGRLRLGNQVSGQPIQFLTADVGVAAVINGAGNVGIGTDSPAKELEIHSDGTTQVRIIGGDDGGAILNFGTTSTPADARIVYSNVSKLMQLRTNNGAYALNIDGAGNVGIGTDAPFNASGTNLQIADAAHPRLFLENTTDINKVYISSYDNSMVFGRSGYGERMRIDAAGNVGIGTSDPFVTARLQVKTDTNRNLAVQTGTTETSGVKLNAFNDAASSNIPLELNGSVTVLKTGEVERMRIDNVGKVGIGAAPQEQLHVQGGDVLLRSEYDANGITDSFIHFQSRGSGNWRNSSIGQRSNALIFKTGGVGSDYTDGTERMRISGDGRVDITGYLYVNGKKTLLESQKIGYSELITTLSTLRNATKDETTVKGLRDAISDAIGGLIEKFEAEIAAMPAPEPEIETMPVPGEETE